jgi:hypothetical protein
VALVADPGAHLVSKYIYVVQFLIPELDFAVSIAMMSGGRVCCGCQSLFLGGFQGRLMDVVIEFTN